MSGGYEARHVPGADVCGVARWGTGCTWKSHDSIVVALEDILEDAPALQIRFGDRPIQVVSIELPKNGVAIEDEVHPLHVRPLILLLSLLSVCSKYTVQLHSTHSRDSLMAQP